ncbi:MAG: decaprenyl-phosphate phosphoribosyltransferase [Flavobacteriales bacterium]|nr:decaprenyl-phosphate phosphoribosyltransferase [Flavobacteriales bacterium]MEB2342161.1 decaprenyl-phosphate phosphoribosyltransferase [Flavobacteriia bacterium]
MENRTPSRPFHPGTLARLLRVQQWIKNGFVLFPAFFAGVLFHPDILWRTLCGFACFSLAASAVYIFNDLRDVEQDRQHPVKRLRPLAAGGFPSAMAPWLSALLAITALGVAWLVKPKFALVLVAYLVMNLLYSSFLKHISIVDVAIIALGFLLRIYAGSVLALVPNSQWIYLVTFLLALFLALAKRRDDLVQAGGGAGLRKSLDGYNKPFVDAMMVALAALVVQSYIMYTVDPSVTGRIGTDKLYVTSGFVVLGMMRYFQITLVEKRSGAPTKLVFTDRGIQLVLLGWLISFGIILYAY